SSFDESARTENRSVEKEAILVWGASSSVGTMGVQTGAQFAAVCATAGEDHSDYIRSPGADRVWDYKDANLLEQIGASAKEDRVVIRRIFLGKGDLRLCREVIGLFPPGTDAGDVSPPVPVPLWGKLASAPPIAVDGGLDLTSKRRQQVEAVFLMPSTDEEKRRRQFYFCMGPWLTQALANGAIRPSPEVNFRWRGLEAINDAMETMKSGVRCCKLVVKIGREDGASYYD
ncbi:hypothetical protein V8F33_009538, partial [Rhypophila sp. PSN 637]